LNDTDRDQTLALAGVLQAAYLVQQLARRGAADREPFAYSIASIFVIHAKTTATIYDGVAGISLGLKLVRDKLGDRNKPEYVELASYTRALIELAARLSKNDDLMARIGQAIQAIGSQVDSPDKINIHAEPSDKLIRDLAGLYQKTLNDMPPRVLITGERVYLDDPAITDKIRAVLLAGVRAAVLWHQVGGRRWHLLFRQLHHSLQARNILLGR